MGQVRVDPDKLEEAADSISRNREAMEKIIRELLQVTFELQISWEGMARKQFFDEFFSKKKSMDDLVKHLHHTELELKKSAKTFREADEKAFGDFNQMGKLSDAYLRGSGRAAGDTIFDPLKKAWNKTSDFFEHLADDPKGTLEDAKYGLRDFMENSIDDTKEEIKDTYEFVKNLWNDPIGTVKSEWNEKIQEMYAIRNVLSDWYVKNVEYGDEESFTESIAYGATSFAIAAVLTKGAGAVGNGARWGRSLSSMSEFQLGSRLEPGYVGSGTQHYLQKAVTYTYEGENGSKTIRLRRGYLAGDKHPVTDIPYNHEGFPIFEPFGEVKLKETDFKKDRPAHDRICSKALYQKIIKDPELASKFTEEEIELFKFGEVPDRFTWHHHQDTGRMQLVDSYLHEKTGHTGGYRIWGKDSDK
ncbi:WXG100 family type VII secretion target [Bacillus sp. 491mf]|uniref:WXG100 family type VII secretion target n=1 Tax=Bacillus sp. 491mf TaxID=1761755 RepID=UPI0008E3DB8B|nr:WXG100 family type VII secretion target [Bacillus sp. 491mf]SFC85404.1 WXG100 family type VII secretion target [Bacillus sp. 491mf]